MTKNFDIEEVRTFITNSSETSKIYIGSDSIRFKKNDIWYAEYATVVVIHKDGNKGGKIFGRLDIERDFDQKKDKPKNRMMNEAIRAAQLYLELEEAIEYRDCEIHLDVNPDEKHGSNVALKEAIGYVRSMTNVTPMVKPNAWCASFAADRFSEVPGLVNKANSGLKVA
jgi:uncharacterized protein